MTRATLSHDFISNVHLLYRAALEEVATRSIIRIGINGHTRHAAPALVSAVAAVETYLNEVTFGSWARDLLPNSPLWVLEQAWVQELDLGAKLVIIPHLLFGSSFARDSQPYQDMSLLIKARNDVVHYKMASNPPKYLKHLEDRNIALSPHPSLRGEMAWIHKLCTSEVIRWANNTATKVAYAIVQFMPNNVRDYIGGELVTNFVEIGEDVPKEYLLGVGIDPQSTKP